MRLLYHACLMFATKHWKAIKGQAGFPISLQATDGRGIDRRILFDEGCGELLCFLAALLIENGFEFRPHCLLLCLGNISQDVVHLVLHAALALQAGKPGLDGIQHGLIPIRDPQIDVLDTAALQVLQQIFPGLLVLSFPDGESQNLAFSRFINADHR